MCGSGSRKVLRAAVIISIIAYAHGQWQSGGALNSNFQRQRRYGEVMNMPSQQPYSQQASQQWNNYRNTNQWSNMQNGQEQQQWNGNLQRQQQMYQQRQKNLVDYPFTVEYVDRRRQNRIGGTKPTSRKGVGSSANSHHDDENLIDYPFTIEYVNNNNMNYPSENQENMAQASLHSNQDSFQLKTHQQPYQQNHHHRHSAATRNDDPSRTGYPGGNRFSGD